MEDLYKKIEALRDMVKGILSKPNSNSLVPALKLPTPKPLSVSSIASTAAPTKIPGVAPPSGKDPNKVAEQLKNPRPKKVKMEILKFDKNGQWSIEEMEKKKWSDEEAEGIRLAEMESANRKMEHTSTGQRGIKAYTSSIHGTAKEQAERAVAGPASPVKKIPVAQYTAEKRSPGILKADNSCQLFEKHDYTGDAAVHGWVSPAGEYHHMEPHEAHGVKLMQLLGIEPTFTTLSGNQIHEPTKVEKAAMQKAFNDGWIQVGSGGQQEAYGYKHVLNNRTHPAAQKLRQLVGKHWNHDQDSNFFVMDDKAQDRVLSIDSQKFAKFGSIMPKKPV